MDGKGVKSKERGEPVNKNKIKKTLNRHSPWGVGSKEKSSCPFKGSNQNQKKPPLSAID